MTESIQEQLKTQVDSQGQGKPSRPNFFRRADRLEVVGFTRELAILAGGQHSLAHALKVLARSISNQDLASAVTTIGMRVEEGVPLSQALSNYPWYFGSVTSGTVRAAESSGNLAEALEQIADNMEEEQAFLNKLTDALTYPMVLLVAFLIVIQGLLFFVIPNFAAYIIQNGGKIEGFNSVVLSISVFMRQWYGMPLLILILIALFLFMNRLRLNNPAFFEKILELIPIIGGLLLKADIKRFVSTLYLLLHNNISLKDSLKLCLDVSKHNYLQKTIRTMSLNVEEGRSMSSAFEGRTRYHPVVIDMISVGEETGSLVPMLKHLDSYIHNDFDRLTHRLSVLLQPLVLVLIGALFVGVFLSFFFPYFDLLTTLSGVH